MRRSARWTALAALAAAVTGAALMSAGHDSGARADAPANAAEIYSLFRTSPEHSEASGFHGPPAGTVIRAAIDRPGRRVFGVATPDGDVCLVVQQGWASKGCLPARELADGRRLMWSFDYATNERIQITALIPDAVSDVRVAWGSGPPVPAVVEHNVVQSMGDRAHLPVTLSWRDAGGTPRLDSTSG
jgi:hypothetical protein